jgi:putative transferase (TIGR04331 family)
MKNKLNFIISYNKEIWKNETKNLFIADPYVYHLMERNNEVKNYDSLKKVKYLRKNKHDLVNDSNYVDNKYFKYIEIISKRLDDIHNKNYGEDFWKKSLSMGFIRNITTFYNTFKICEEYFNTHLHDCNILFTDSFFIPNDFEDHRAFFQNSDFGQEQIFSIYINLFYPNRFQALSLKNPFKKNNKSTWIQTLKKQSWVNHLKSIYYKLKFGTSKKKIRIGILGSYFSFEYLKILFSKSQNKIGFLNIPEYSYNNVKVKFSHKKRLILSQFEDDFDNFDKFFFTSLYYCFPRIFLEEYEKIEVFLKKNIDNYKKLNYVVSENWISDTQNSIFLALAKQRFIKNISNEHNCFFHPYAGSYINHVISMSDIFTTLGWDDKEKSKVVKSGSLFKFKINKSYNKTHKILFIAGALGAKAPHFSGAYGYCEEKAINSVNFNISFFNNLRKSTLKEITYRGYPTKRIKNIQLYDKEYYYQNILKYFNTNMKNDSSKKQISESSLVIVDYLSTTHIESILMDIPTVFFWDSDSYYLNRKFKDFFKPLIEVGICQTSPEEASLFVEKIKNEPNKWWNSSKVQNAKHSFLNKNLGAPQLLLDYLINLASQNNNIKNC